MGAFLQKAINVSAFAENGAVMAEPIISEGVAYVGACETYFYAIDIHDGHMRWAYKTGGVILGPAVMHEDVLYFGSFDTYLYALSKEGNLLWRFKAGGMITGKPAVHNGVVYFGSCDNYFYAVSLKTRQALWRFLAGDEIVCDILIDENRIYFGSLDGYLYCMDLNGNLAWKFRSGGSVMLGAPSASKELVFFASADQNIYAVTKEGNFKWGFRTGDMCFNAPVIFGDIVCIGSRDRYFYALDCNTGALAWKFRGNDEVDFTPRIYNGRIYFSSDKVYALDIRGNLSWSYQMPPYYISCGIAADSGVAIFGAMTGYVYGLNAETGQELWRFKTNSSVPPRGRNFIAPPKWDPEIYDKFEPISAEESKKPRKEFQPYTFTTFDSSFFDREKKKYVAPGDVSLNPYEAANNPALYAEKLNEDEKKRRKKDEETIRKQFFGG